MAGEPVRVLSTSRASAVYLAVGVVLTGVYFLLPFGGTAQSVLYDVIGVSSAAAIGAAIWLRRPGRWLPWALFALGNLFFAVADVIFNLYVNPPVPSVADAFYLSGYPLLGAGLILLVVRAGGHHRTAALGEAAIFTVAFALAQWVFLMNSILDGSGSLGARVVATAYPVMDIVLLACLAGFFVTAVWRSPAFTLLVASVGLLLLADEVYGVGPNSYRSGDWIDAGWLLSYVLWATAALHPSMLNLSAARQKREAGLGRARFALLTTALLAAPVVLLIQWVRDAPLEVPAVVLAGAAISLLVALRLAGILRAVERLRTRERQARAEALQAQRKLVAQNERLVEADRLKDEFVALISHDLRTPLTSIIGYVELALDDDIEPPLDDERRNFLQVVARSSDRLLRLVDDLLFVARLQAGQLVLAAVPLDLAEASSQAVDEARPRAEQKGVAVSFLGDAHVPVEADRGRIFQLLDNVISNAIKFTPQGGRVDVRVVRTPDGAVLEVADTGIGLAPGDVERVFDRFFRAARATDRQIPGTGLGLFIARAIAEAHGGRISASSAQGAGTTFRIELPASLPPKPNVDAEELVA